MSKNRYFNTDFWSDPWVVDNLDPMEAYLFIYLFTNSHTNLAGVYELSLRVMSFETKIDKADLEGHLAHLQPKVLYENGWIILRNGIKNQNYHNSKIKTAIVDILGRVPNEILQHMVYPSDWGQKPEKKPEQQKLVDDPSIGQPSVMDAPSHLTKLNLTKLNSTKPNAADKLPAGFKKNWAKASEADRAQAERDAKRKDDKPAKVVVDAADLAREKLRKRGLKV